MKKSLSEKILYLITLFLLTLTILFCLNYPSKENIYLFLFVFVIAFWQRKHLQVFFQKIKNPKISSAFYILIGWLGAVFLEFSLGLSPFHPKPITNYLVGLGFYLPYFIIWLVFIKRYHFTLFEVFYLSGLGRLFFDLLITHKLLVSAAVATHAISAFLIFFIQAIITLVIFGILTTLPVLCLATQENSRNDKPLKEYLIGLTPGFLTTGVFIIWMVVLKMIFT